MENTSNTKLTGTQLNGVGVALITPFSKQGEIDFAALAKVTESVIPHSAYLVVMGTTGENPTLNREEQNKVLATVNEVNAGKLPIVLGVGGYDTAEVSFRLGQVPDGVQGILSVCPYYNRPTQEGLKAHFWQIASESKWPVILYNVPTRTGVNLKPETALQLAMHPNIIGIKEASGQIEQALVIGAGKNESFALISGDDLLTVPLVALGASGVISVIANALPAFYNAQVQAALAGNFQIATKMAADMLALNNLLYQEGNPAGIKGLCSILGLAQPYTRLPLMPASDSLMKQMEKELIVLKAHYPELIP